jgi:hypothetical protein
MTGTKATPRWLRSEKEGLTQTDASLYHHSENRIFFLLFQETFTTKEEIYVNYNNKLVSHVDFIETFLLCNILVNTLLGLLACRLEFRPLLYAQA